jgi:hypothetical protein
VLDSAAVNVAASITPPERRWLLPLALFAGLVLTYGACSPGTVRNQGYCQEEVEAAAELGRLLGLPLTTPGSGLPHSRHGVIEPLLKLPFLAVGEFGQRLLGLESRGRPAVTEAMVALEPVLLMAGLVTVLFLWLRRETRSDSTAWLLALGAAFGTLLWPYATTGLETTQSAALLLAGYLALGDHELRWGRTLAFAVTAAVAISAKSTGVILLPAVVWLVYRMVRPRHGRATGSAWAHLGVIVLVILAVRAANSVAIARHMQAFGGLDPNVFLYFAHDPAVVPINALALLASPNKGLLVFAPLAFLGLCCTALAWRRAPDTTVFALLALVVPALAVSVLLCPTEETWGPRYLMAAVAPLLLVLGAAWRDLERRSRLFVLAMLLGVPVSALGVAVEYGALHKTATAMGECRLSVLQSDPAWNHPRFNLWVLETWWAARSEPPGRALAYQPEDLWWCGLPNRAFRPDAVDVAPLVHPQPLLLRAWDAAAPDGLRVLRWGLLCSLLTGVGVLAWGSSLARRAPGVADQGPTVDAGE